MRTIVVDIFDVDDNFEDRIIRWIEEINIRRNGLTIFTSADEEQMERLLLPVKFFDDFERVQQLVDVENAQVIPADNEVTDRILGCGRIIWIVLVDRFRQPNPLRSYWTVFCSEKFIVINSLSNLLPRLFLDYR